MGLLLKCFGAALNEFLNMKGEVRKCMKKDRFFMEMENAYREVNLKDDKKEKDFIVDNNNSYYEVDCKKYKELRQR